MCEVIYIGNILVSLIQNKCLETNLMRDTTLNREGHEQIFTRNLTLKKIIFFKINVFFYSK